MHLNSHVQGYFQINGFLQNGEKVRSDFRENIILNLVSFNIIMCYILNLIHESRKYVQEAHAKVQRHQSNKILKIFKM